jgi:hypothetical protein
MALKVASIRLKRNPAPWYLFKGAGKKVSLVFYICAAFFGVKIVAQKNGLLIKPLWSVASEQPDKATTVNNKVLVVPRRELDSTKQKTIPIQSLPPELQGNGSSEDAIRLIAECLAAYRDSFATVEACVGQVDYAVEGRHFQFNATKPSGGRDVAYNGYVRSLQVCFKVLGYYSGRTDGDLASLTDAVIHYQKDKHLKPDGIVGHQTWSIIKADVRKALIDNHETPQLSEGS